MSTESTADAAYSLMADGWLTEKLGRPAWRVEQNSRGEPLARLQTAKRAFAYAKVVAGDVEALWRLSDKGFRIVDVAVTLEGSISPTPRGSGVRFARSVDRDTVAGIAGRAFCYSRFHLDPLISTEAANAIKSEWASNYFFGKRGDGMIVAEREGRVVGFLQLLWQPYGCLLVDLIGVDPAHQGQGIGGEMILFAAERGTGDQRRPACMRVGTQAANTPSVRLYESLGFRLINAQYVLHFHNEQSVA